ncbi:hypothetical protein, partial [Microcoleus sp. bin38.metabat.b11b12b14.051]|uniref:hypothetical protein n=1 Tax=Microcoleus sp. bin38.metabat.b11b12b14.051 TaxID=2742709 RepID=UPI0025D763E4
MPAPALAIPLIPIVIKAKVAAGAALGTKAAVGVATATKTAGGIGVVAATAAPIVPAAKVAATGSVGAKVAQVVASAPTGLKPAAPGAARIAYGAGQALGNLGRQGLGALGAIGAKVVAGVSLQTPTTGISDPRDNANFNPATAASRTKPAPILQPSSSPEIDFGSGIGRADPLSPSGNPRSPVMPQIKSPEKPSPRAPLTPGGKAAGRINIAPISADTSAIARPKSLDQVSEGGVNLLTPIVNFLKKLDLDIEGLKLLIQESQPDFKPLLQEISKLVTPLAGMIAAIPETFKNGIVDPIMKNVVELLVPIAEITALSTETSAKTPRVTTEGVAELLGPILLGITLIGAAVEGLAKAMSGLSLKTAVAIPQGMAVSAQIPQGMAVSAQIPQGMAATAQIPMGLAATAQIPIGLAATAQIPLGLAATAQIPQSQQVLAVLPQTISLPQTITTTATADLTSIDTQLEKLLKTAEKTKEDIDKCCKDIKDKLKKKKKEDDDRFPEFKNNGFIECDGATIPYNYAGEGLKGLYEQQNVILGINKMMLKKVCDIEFPLIEGGGTYVCDETFGTYNYSGVGLLGLQNQIDRVLDFNKKILDEVCDIEVPAFTFPDIFGGGTYVCDETFGTYNYSGVGLLGLQSQIDRVLDFNKKILDEVCDIEVPAFTFPDIFGGGTYVCDETFGTYNYS